MEFGNIGNYYVIEPLVQQLHAAFPNLILKTTFQMSQDFCDKNGISETLPMDLYYGWTGYDLETANYERTLTNEYQSTGQLRDRTPYIDAVLWADIIIDYSGDIWGDNANFLGEDRFEVGLIKDRIAMNLNKNVVMLAGSPGPFRSEKNKELAKAVYKDFNLVTNREPLSTDLLKQEGFDISKTHSIPCPSFLFQGSAHHDIQPHLEKTPLNKPKGVRRQPIVGFILCGWNFEQGPFDKWPRDDDEYRNFAEAVEFLTNTLGAKVCLMSHSNGFDIPPAPFKLKHGRDYFVIKQLEKILEKRAITSNYFVLDDVYDAWDTKGIIGTFDMLISGRVHGAIAGLSQAIPTVIIDYGHEPKAHKLQGFAKLVDIEGYVANPNNKAQFSNVIQSCWLQRISYQKHLDDRVPAIQSHAKKAFSLLRSTTIT